MLDIPDPVLDEPAGPAVPRDRDAAPVAPSPLRAWSMWGGLGSVGVICAASLAHAASRLAQATGLRPSDTAVRRPAY
jgi:hypothetical protein